MATGEACPTEDMITYPDDCEAALSENTALAGYSMESE
jgi:hypothetical protein